MCLRTHDLSVSVSFGQRFIERSAAFCAAARLSGHALNLLSGPRDAGDSRYRSHAVS